MLTRSIALRYCNSRPLVSRERQAGGAMTVKMPPWPRRCIGPPSANFLTGSDDQVEQIRRSDAADLAAVVSVLDEF